MRGATMRSPYEYYSSRNFNPRAPCGARPIRNPGIDPATEISIHAPHAGRDADRVGEHSKGGRFQSTRPMRGATFITKIAQLLINIISIHAPHAGRDLRPGLCNTVAWAISIHAPHAGRDYRRGPPARNVGEISIHAPHAGRDFLFRLRHSFDKRNFNPRAPCGARPTTSCRSSY